MKCPKCGFVSFPGHEQCKKCGHRFTQVKGRAEGIPPLFHHPTSETQKPSEPESESVLDQTELGEQEAGELDVALEPQGASSTPDEPDQKKPAPPPSEPPGLSPWQSDLAARVQEYRQHRARLHPDEGKEDHKTFNFDFGSSTPKPEEPHPNVIEFPSGEEAEKHAKPKPQIKSAPPSFGMASFESAFKDKDNDENLNPPSAPEPDSRGETAPLEIELGPTENSSVGIGEGDSDVPIAHMNMRFFAGLIDALVLLSGAAVYALIFWRVGGSFSPGPLDLVTAAVIGTFFTLLYFAGCTAIASATPGLIWARLEVITFEGNPPRLSHCLWRGIGYLVSMSALMLGFIWAVVDAEGLTWHDRMSRTFIVPAERP